MKLKWFIASVFLLASVLYLIPTFIMTYLLDGYVQRADDQKSHRQRRYTAPPAVTVTPDLKSVRKQDKGLVKTSAGARNNSTANPQPITDNTPGAVRDTEEEMRERGRRINERCKQLESPEELALIWQELPFAFTTEIDPLRFMLTPLFKVGYSTWRELLSQNPRNKLPDKRNITITSIFHVRGVYGVGLWELDQAVMYRERILFIRDPYDRLVSAYKNRMLENEYGRHLHQPCKWFNMESDVSEMTFPTFIKCIVDQLKNASAPYMTANGTTHLDPHWKPQVYQTNLCRVNYTLVGEFSRFSDDLQTTLRITGIDEYAKPRKANPSRLFADKPLSYWYRQLDPESLDVLKQLYKYDCLLLGYDPDPPLTD